MGVDSCTIDGLLSGRLGPGAGRLRDALSRVGTVVAGRYRVERLLGAGGMGDVYAAVHVRNGHPVALKVLHQDLAADGALYAHFLREGYLANVVSHPGTIHVLDDDVTADGCPFLVMELLEGETLEARWRRRGRRMTIEEVVRVVCSLLDVLGAAHARGVVHRDIKPDNVFLTKQGTLRLLDFGIAFEHRDRADATPPGMVVGTLGFMPPEQARGSESDVGARSDLWSVGATAFTLLSGRLVHDARTNTEMLRCSATLPVPPIASVAPEVPQKLAEVLDRALAFDPRDRWASAVAMRGALMRAAEAALESWRSTPIDLVQRRSTESQEPPPPPLEEAVPGELALATTEVARPSSRISPEELKAWRRSLRRGRCGAALRRLALVVAMAALTDAPSPALSNDAASGGAPIAETGSESPSPGPDLAGREGEDPSRACASANFGGPDPTQIVH